jgi:hypothetical protein
MPHQQYNVNNDGDAPTFEQEQQQQQQQHQGSYRDASSSHQLLPMTPRQFAEPFQPAPYHDVRQQQQNSFQSPPQQQQQDSWQQSQQQQQHQPGHPTNLMGVKRAKDLVVVEKKKAEVERQFNALSTFEKEAISDATRIACEIAAKDIDQVIKTCVSKFDEFLRSCQQQFDEKMRPRDDYQGQRDDFEQQRDDFEQQRDDSEQQRDDREEWQRKRFRCPTQRDDSEQQRDDSEQQRDDFEQKRDDFEQHDDFEQQRDDREEWQRKRFRSPTRFSSPMLTDRIRLADVDGEQCLKLSQYGQEVSDRKKKKSQLKKSKSEAYRNVKKATAKTSNPKSKINKVKKLKLQVEKNYKKDCEPTQKTIKQKTKILKKSLLSYNDYMDRMCKWLVDVERRDTGEARGFGIFAIKLICRGRPVAKYQGHMVHPDGTLAVKCTLTSILFSEIPVLASLPFSKNHSASGKFY